MQNILVLDLETTSLILYEAKIVQIGMIYNGKDKSIYLNPGIPIPEGSSRIHNITDDMVKDKPKFEDVAQKLYELILATDLIIGYNIRNYDWNILTMELLRCGIKLPKVEMIDVMDLVHLYEPNKKLTSVYLRYFNENLKGSHDGLNDAKATLRVYEYLKGKLY